MKKYYYASIIYLILGMIAGVFYREITRMNEFQGETMLKGLHTHFLVLGFLFFLVVLLLEKVFQFSKTKSEKLWFISYQIVFIYFIITMGLRGVAQVKGFEVAGLSHMAGLAHALLGANLIWFMFLLRKKVV